MKPVARILVVEDEFLIAMELAATLAAHGFMVLGPAASVDEALELVRRERPDGVILDLNLRGRSATPVAVLLRQMNLPFVIASAYSEMPQEAALQGITNVGKPTSTPTLIEMLLRITDSSL